MAAWRRTIELPLEDADSAKLRSIAHSRTEPASRVERARILLAYREDPSFFAVGRRLGLHHQTVQRCVERAVAEGPMAALDDRPILKLVGHHGCAIVGQQRSWQGAPHQRLAEAMNQASDRLIQEPLHMADQPGAVVENAQRRG